ncbi:DNA polymerase III subunit chi [Silanimonas lenta]|jgi:DNA polymerase-3 subunit chi|uniref:DNA polymerase III subunit chi n=1 Tax=Silanimonas lenta TaxID=265429 RepID=UPI00042921FC|nr:DNA polymerase III subunit chi [Silanimonas lenta]
MRARADFYLIDKPRFREQPLLLVCELVKRCHATGKPTLVLCASQAEAEELDDLLWAFEEDSFIEHQIAGLEEDEADVPVLIAPPGIDVPLRPFVLNLRAEAVPAGFERVLEVVPADPAARGPLRERWRQYQALGLELHKHDM